MAGERRDRGIRWRVEGVTLRCILLAVGVRLVVSNSHPTAGGFHNAALATKSLEDRRFATPVVEQLLELPRDLWPKAGQFLRDVTGEDFGPRSGDVMPEVLDAQKHWKARWKKQEDG